MKHLAVIVFFSMALVSCSKKPIDQSIEGSWYHKYGKTYYTNTTKWLELEFSEQKNEVILIPHLREAGDSWVKAVGTFTRNGEAILFDMSFKTEAMNPVLTRLIEGDILMGPDNPIAITVKYETSYNGMISTDSITFSRDKDEH